MFLNQPRVSAAPVGFTGSHCAPAMKHANLNVSTNADARIGESGFRTWRPPV